MSIHRKPTTAVSDKVSHLKVFGNELTDRPWLRRGFFDVIPTIKQEVQERTNPPNVLALIFKLSNLQVYQTSQNYKSPRFSICLNIITFHSSIRPSGQLRSPTIFSSVFLSVIVQWGISKHLFKILALSILLHVVTSFVCSC
jgi:hypothetical protein